jgi:bacteriocin-like protein
MPHFTSEEIRRAMAAVQDLVDCDEEFRNAVGESPRDAIEQALGIQLPANYEIKLHKSANGIQLTGEFTQETDELSDDELEAVIGGVAAIGMPHQKTIEQRYQ